MTTDTNFKHNGRLTPAGKQEILRLRQEEGLKLADIAQRLDLSLGTVWAYAKGIKKGAVSGQPQEG